MSKKNAWSQPRQENNIKYETKSILVMFNISEKTVKTVGICKVAKYEGSKIFEIVIKSTYFQKIGFR